MTAAFDAYSNKVAQTMQSPFWSAEYCHSLYPDRLSDIALQPDKRAAQAAGIKR